MGSRSRRWRRRWRRWRKRHLRRTDALLVIGAVAVSAFVGFVVLHDADAEAPVVNEPEPTLTVPDARTLLVVGDSWTQGGPANRGPEWPYLLDLPDNWTVRTDAAGGTGYVGAGTVPHAGIMSGRLDSLVEDYRPDVALIALGRNDVDQPTDRVLGVARDALSSLKAGWPECRIVVLSPFSPGDPDPATVALTDGLREVAASLGLDYVDVSRIIPSPPGGLIANYHPTDAGHRLIAAAVDAQLGAV